MNPLWLLKLKSAGGFLKEHWGKVAATGFFAVWILFTISLYNINQNLHEELGASGAAISVCIAERSNMDNVLVKLKSDIALIQADNAEYKANLALASIKIGDLKDAINISLIEIDKEVIPVECEATFDWMLNKALEQ